MPGRAKCLRRVCLPPATDCLLKPVPGRQSAFLQRVSAYVFTACQCVWHDEGDSGLDRLTPPPAAVVKVRLPVACFMEIPGITGLWHLIVKTVPFMPRMPRRPRLQRPGVVEGSTEPGFRDMWASGGCVETGMPSSASLPFIVGLPRGPPAVAAGCGGEGELMFGAPTPRPLR